MVLAPEWLRLLVLTVVVASLGSVGAVAADDGVGVPCNEATSVAATEDGRWVVTGTQETRAYGSEWDRLALEESAFSDGGSGLARGPNGSLWLLSFGTAAQLDTTLALQKVRDTESAGDVTRSDMKRRDLAFTDRWLVLDSGELTAYDAEWDRRELPAVGQSLPPTDASGMAVTAEAVAFVTPNGTVEVYGRPLANATAPRRTVSLEVDQDVTDIARAPDGTWLVVQPDAVTAYTDGWEPIGQRTAIEDEGCAGSSQSPADGDTSGGTVREVVYGSALFFAVAVPLVYLFIRVTTHRR